ncbi:MAG: hypothetical protein ACOYMW_11445, partial [Candidatus Competibacteraceae bacterium]
KAKKEADEAAATAAKEAADAEKEADKQRAAGAAFMTSVLSSLALRLQELSPAARAAFDGFVQGTDVASMSIQQLKDRVSKDMDEIALSVKNLGSGGLVDWANNMNIKALEIEQAFLSQKIAVDSAAEALNRFADTGGNAAEAERLIAQYGEGANQELGLLNEQDLSNLRSALEKANQKLRDMQQEAQDAQVALAEMNAEIMAESGDTAGADRLKLQIEQSVKLAEWEQKRRDAEMTGNKEAAATYAELIRRQEELGALKLRNQDADIAANDKTSKTNKRTITQTGELAFALNSARDAANGLNSVDLSALHGQVNQLGESVIKLRRTLSNG